MVSLTEQQAIVKLAEEGVDVHLEASDIKIGAVEIQDKEDGKRVDVENMNVPLEGTPGLQQGMLTKTQVLSADGLALVSPRKENGHGSGSGTPSFVQFTNPIAGLDVPHDAYKMIEHDEAGTVYSDTNPKPVINSAPSAIFGDELTLPDTLPSQAIRDGAIIKAPSDNTDSIFVNGMELEPGESIPIAIDNLSKILITGTAGDRAYYIGS